MHFICANTFEKLMRIRQRAKIMLFVLVCLTQYAAAKLSEISNMVTLLNWTKKGKPVCRLKNLSQTNPLKDSCHTTTCDLKQKYHPPVEPKYNFLFWSVS